jgi:hypothetical protein
VRVWGVWSVLTQQVSPSEGSGWLGWLFGPLGLLAGLVIAVRAYDSGRVITRMQHESTLKALKEAHERHASDLRAQAKEDREQRDRWEKIAWDAIRANNRRSRGGADDDEGLARLG